MPFHRQGAIRQTPMLGMDLPPNTPLCYEFLSIQYKVGTRALSKADYSNCYY